MLTHRTVQSKLALYMRSKGWRREKTSRHFVLNGISDEVFTSEDGQELHAEVKPEFIETNELWKGIGQTVRILAEPSWRAVLVCPEKYGDLLLKIFRELQTDRIGLLVYDSNGNFTPLLDVWGNRNSAWLDKESTDIEKDTQLKVPEIDPGAILIGKTVLECLNCRHFWIARQQFSTARRTCPKCGTIRIRISNQNA